MGIKEALRCPGSFDTWCQWMTQLFDDALVYHSNGRGSVFVHAEALFLKRDFLNLVEAAREIMERSGSPSELVVDPPSVEETGAKVYRVDEKKLSNDAKRRCRCVLDEFNRQASVFQPFRHLNRQPLAPTFVGVGDGCDVGMAEKGGSTCVLRRDPAWTEVR